jgi:uncharacterized protein with von Willebrand factor type A (vWA) domain
MASFTDAKGDAWTVAVTYHDVQEVEKATGVYLPSLLDDKLETLSRLHEDFKLLVTVVAQLCDSQIEQRGMTAEDFAKRLGGDVLEGAAHAVVEATIDFFPNPHRREAMRKAWGKIKQASQIYQEMMTPIVMAGIDETARALGKLSSASSGSASVSSASSPGDALCGNY